MAVAETPAVVLVKSGCPRTRSAFWPLVVGNVFQMSMRLLSTSPTATSVPSVQTPPAVDSVFWPAAPPRLAVQLVISACPSTKSAAWPLLVMGWVQISTRLLRLSDTISLPGAATVAPGKLNVVAEQPEAPVVIVVCPNTKSAGACVVV